MANYRITTFDGFSFTQAGVYAKSGTVGNLTARYTMVHPPHSEPLDPYGGASAPLSYGVIDQNILITGDPDTVNGLETSLRAKVGRKGTLSGRAGSSTGTCSAYCIGISGNWEAPFLAGAEQWLNLTVSFQPLTEWA